jgi:hypothetical protein
VDEVLAIRRSPRTRRQVHPATLRVARVFGFRYDKLREAYVLRLVGNHVGPVIRTGQPVDRVAAQMQWYDSMDKMADPPHRTGRFVREPKSVESASQDLLNH